MIASHTAPVMEAVEQAESSQIVELVDYFSPGELATAMEGLLAQEGRRELLGRNARQFIETNHSLHRWLPEHCRLVEEA